MFGRKPISSPSPAFDPLNVEAYLPVRYYGELKVGDTGIVHPDPPVGGNHEAKVSIVDQVFDAASGTFGVRLSLPNPDNLLPGGLRCHVSFDFPEKAASKYDPAATPGIGRAVTSTPRDPRTERIDHARKRACRIVCFACR